MKRGDTIRDMSIQARRKKKGVRSGEREGKERKSEYIMDNRIKNGNKNAIKEHNIYIINT